mgnify:CR=1 FL=1
MPIEDKKVIKSINIHESRKNKVDNYIAQNGGYFGDIVEKGIDLFFEALENGHDVMLETLGLEDPENTILIPLSLYLDMKKLSHTQVKNLEKKKKIIVKSYSETSGKGKISKNRFVVLHVNNPDFYQAKVALLEKTQSNFQDQLNELREELRKSQV